MSNKQKLITLIFLIVLTLKACKNSKQSSKPNNTNNIEYANINFFKIQGCCTSYLLEKGNTIPKMKHNSENYDVTICFIPKKQKLIKEINDSVKFDEDNLANEKQLKEMIFKNLKNFNCYALSVKGEYLTPVYEGYDSPSYFDYKYPIVANIFEFNIKNRKWIKLDNRKVDEDSMYELKDTFFKKVSKKKIDVSHVNIEKVKGQAKTNSIKHKIDSIEKGIREKTMSDFEKKIIDIDNDGDDDYLYFYQPAESKYLEVYLNNNSLNLKKVIDEFCYTYSLNNNKLQVKRNHCCGESPFKSVRKYGLKKDSVFIIENYVLCNNEQELVEPKNILNKEQIYNVRIKTSDYNVRYSPNIKYFKEEDSFFSCEENTNIIGKLKKNSSVKVLSTMKTKERNWLFVEIDEKNLNAEKCQSPITYDYKNQKLRAWISDKLTTRIKN